MIFKTKSAITGAALLAAAAFTGQASAQTVTLKMMTFVPPISNPVKTFLIPWAKKVEAASKGKIKIQGYWSMQLGGKAPQLLDQVKDGVVDIVWTLPGFTPGRMPRTEPFELPFVHRDAMSTTLALQDYQDKWLKEDLKDYHPLLVHAHDGFLFMTKKPIMTMADLKGMKIRAASRGGVWLLNALGATGVGLPLPAIPAALSKGVIDGVTVTYEIVPSIKVPDLVSNYTTVSGEQPRLGTNIFTFLMNKNSYAKLSPELKKVIDDHSGRNIAKWAGQNWLDVEKPGIEAVKKLKKNKFHVISPAETAKIKKAAEPVIAQWMAEMKKINADGPAMLKDARDLIAKYAKK
ncbi:MAG: TRAP transporter substrate-binding protein [Beijerinckiaceae bacterium]|jgi:TRAP-type transport system periplasmic protein|nr:TRAP transporter substrate-binding protein [Beijerinckiaceae bacterium]